MNNNNQNNFNNYNNANNNNVNNQNYPNNGYNPNNQNYPNNGYNQNNNNIVAPQSVDLNSVTVNNDDTLLNRERSNIVSATIQANNNIDQKAALEVNNEIKVEERHKYMFAVVIITVVVVSAAAGFGIYALTHAAMNYGETEKTTTTTTTTSEADRFNAYLRNYSRVRKFVSSNYILLLSTEGCDLKNNQEHYLLINTSKDGIISKKNGTYTIENNTIKLDDEVLEYGKNGINYQDELLAIMDSEMKYYQYKDSDTSYLLIINATLKNDISMFITSTKDNIDVKIESFIETESSITLGDNTVFTKVEGNNLTYNNYTLNMVS